MQSWHHHNRERVQPNYQQIFQMQFYLNVTEVDPLNEKLTVPCGVGGEILLTFILWQAINLSLQGLKREREFD